LLLPVIPTCWRITLLVRAPPFKPKADAQLSMATTKAVATFMVAIVS
jgi:hypothetical protein